MKAAQYIFTTTIIHDHAWHLKVLCSVSFDWTNTPSKNYSPPKFKTGMIAKPGLLGRT